MVSPLPQHWDRMRAVAIRRRELQGTLGPMGLAWILCMPDAHAHGRNEFVVCYALSYLSAMGHSLVFAET